MHSDCRDLELISQPPSPKVLIAEDELLLRLMLSDVLRDHGHQVFEAANASEALSVLQTTSDIAVVISDMHMKSKDDGMVLASFVRQNHPHALLLLQIAAHVTTAALIINLVGRARHAGPQRRAPAAGLPGQRSIGGLWAPLMDADKLSSYGRIRSAIFREDDRHRPFHSRNCVPDSEAAAPGQTGRHLQGCETRCRPST